MYRFENTQTSYKIRIHRALHWFIPEAQLPERVSASATHVFLSSLNDHALHWTPHPLYNYL